MSKTTQIPPAAMTQILGILAAAVLKTAPPEVQEAIRKAREDREQTPAQNKAEPEDSCDCTICALRKALFPKDEAPASKATKRVGFDLSMTGSLPMEISELVGGINTGPDSKNDKLSALRTLAAVLIDAAKGSDAETADRQILQSAAVEHFTKGIHALNALRATA
ncbi:hypothetical protein LZ683_08695 [Comamonas testosteroni]|uniref:hypothetical protein n=1 Tax=Comamonas testosteroni TaxID=285 RepID=UPI0023AB13C3|nr:hypothetical protein [Comamonas testosteroni]WEE79419.1 hypothetical protein LZ683_08695 [Comamonas testosteroni]